MAGILTVWTLTTDSDNGLTCEVYLTEQEVHAAAAAWVKLCWQQWYGDKPMPVELEADDYVEAWDRLTSNTAILDSYSIADHQLTIINM